MSLSQPTRRFVPSLMSASDVLVGDLDFLRVGGSEVTKLWLIR